MITLPAELWNAIFDIAADEDIIFDHGLPTVMAESTWFNSADQWQLRAPQESLHLVQRRSYATKKAIISTCRTWRQLGSEFLVRCLFFDDPKKLQSLCSVLDRNSNLGWWTRRIHINRFYEGPHDAMDALVSIIRMCPNLEIFVVNWPISSGFGPVADALCTYCAKSLRTVHWHIPSETLPKVIWSLDSLQSLRSVHIEVESPATETLYLGSAADLHLTLRNLEQLSLRGHFQDFLEQITGWSLPSLRSLSLDCMATSDLPDIMEFLAQHGSGLMFLDLNCVCTLNTAAILDLCPSLTSFTFNADWYLSTQGDDSSSDTVTFVNRPHRNITEIGCHGLLESFGVGFGMSQIRTHIIQRTNEKNMAALTRVNFPNLKKVRVLSRPLLRALEKTDGPTAGCLQRWDKWWNMFYKMGVRLEDCTGALLGTLPPVDMGDDDMSDEEESESDDGDEEEEEISGGPPRLAKGTINELRVLLDECRKMSNEREELSFPQISFQSSHAIMNDAS